MARHTDRLDRCDSVRRELLVTMYCGYHKY